MMSIKLVQNIFLSLSEHWALWRRMIPSAGIEERIPCPSAKLSKKDWICQFRPTSLDLSLGLVENETGRGVFSS